MQEIEEKLKKMELEKLELEVQNIKKPVVPKRLWNSLEITKVLVSLLLPIILIVISSRISDKTYKNNQQIDSLSKANEIALEKNKRIYNLRTDFYHKISKPLNEIFCYSYYVGKWKELTPKQIIENKRLCDEIMYSYQPFFREEFFKTYQDFISTVFEEYSGMGTDAKIKTDRSVHKAYYKGEKWDVDWNKLFIDDEIINDDTIRRNLRTDYDKLLNGLFEELDIKEQSVNNEYKDFKPQKK